MQRAEQCVGWVCQASQSYWNTLTCVFIFVCVFVRVCACVFHNVTSLEPNSSTLGTWSTYLKTFSQLAECFSLLRTNQTWTVNICNRQLLSWEQAFISIQIICWIVWPNMYWQKVLLQHNSVQLRAALVRTSASCGWLFAPSVNGSGGGGVVSGVRG